MKWWRLLTAMTVMTLACAVAPTIHHAAAAADSMMFFMDGENTSAIASSPHVSSTSFLFTGSSTMVDVSGFASGLPFSARFVAPTGESLAVGTYQGTQEFQGVGVAGFQIHLTPTTCSEPTGRLIIDDIVLTDGAVTTFAARWERHCRGAGADFGAISVNSSITYPERSFDHRSLQFGSISLGDAATLPVTVLNLGPAPLHITADEIIGVQGGAFSIVDDSCAGATIAPGGSCTVQVRFDAVNPIGTRYAWLTLYDDIAPSGGAGFAISLVGTVASSDGEFTALTPARVLDTRDGTGAPMAPIGQRSSLQVQIAGRGGVPETGVTAVVMNVTAMNATAPTFVTIWPGTAPRPTVSNVNPVPGSVIPNQATVTLSYDGKVTAYNHNGTVNLVFDVVGFYADSSGPAGSRFHAVEPFRLFDTRDGTGGVPTEPVDAAETLSYDLDGAGGILPADGTTGVVLNVTYVNPTAPSYVTVYPGDTTLPTTSSLNLAPGTIRPNMVTVRVPTDGVVKFYNAFGSTDLVVDVIGYYDLTRLSSSTGRFVPVLAARAYDTRDYGIALGPDELGFFEIAAYDFVGVDLGASAVVLNVTAVTPTADGYLAVFPGDLCDVPTTSNVNFAAGQTIPNAVVVGLSTGLSCDIARGWIAIYNPFGDTHVIIDVAGWFMS